MKTLALASAAVVALSTAAGAATISPYNYGLADSTGDSVLTTGETYSITYETGGLTWDIAEFSFTANGFAGNLNQLSFTITDASGANLYTFDPASGTTVANGTRFVSGFTTDQNITLSFSYDGAQPAFANYTFTATVADTPAPVPLPAAGLLLLAGVGGLAGVKRLRRKA
ncbi:VPLPA-CTERM sorting domain-containing protein [Frigidibacter sp. MR17.24]|uniref:VPLPA-CTERM sorting domain-containing protein n=1 Tax=Frigidibacter sp. MR17.24 TaxID=3127345 RepID=UPI0030130288